jgi:indole-3-glycerol phosphate synthase
LTILDKILAHKRIEVGERKSSFPASMLEKSALFSAPVISMKKAVGDSTMHGIIAEFKKKSPSKGVINADVSIEEVTTGYVNAGASGLSVLTDTNFFGGSNEDFLQARRVNQCPMLRKDFVIDEYQILEAKSIGADVILLIAAALDPKKLSQLASFAHSLELEVLLEIHDEKELRSNEETSVEMIGVNNRSLKTFEVATATSRQLAPLIPDGVLKISESGIESVEVIRDLRTYGFKGFLMGQHFMQTSDPGRAAADFIKQL